MSRSRLVLFDIDGTIMRGAGAHHKEALLEGVRRVTGRAASFDGIDTAGKLDMDLISELLGTPAEKQLLEEIAQESQRAYVTNCSHDLSPFVCRGARELIEHLTMHGAALALVTGNLSAIGWRDNRFKSNGGKPTGALGQLVSKLVGSPLPDILYDGMVDPRKLAGSSLPSALAVHIRNNGEAGFAKFDLAALGPDRAAGKAPRVVRDLTLYSGELPSLEPVSIEGVK